MSAVGIDALKIELGGGPKIFEGLLGIAVTCKDETSFIKLYRECMTKSLAELEIKTPRVVLKAYDVSKLAPEHENEIIIPFLDYLNKEIERIDIYSTRYNPKKLPSVSVFGEDQPTTKSPVEFIRLISNGYPHCCGYWYLNEYSSKGLGKMYLDHFESCHTPAWDSLSKFKGLTVVYKGGNCNCLISSADLLVRLTATEVKRKNEDFNREGLGRIHSDFSWFKKVFTHDLGGSTQILKFMAPITRREIELSKYIARPLVFIPTESLAGVPTREERDLFESLPVFDDLSNFLFFTKGSFKYFRPSVDIRTATEGDYFLVLGPNSESMYTYLKNCGTKLTRMTTDELREKTDKFIN